MCLGASQTQREVWNGRSALGRQNNKRKQRTWKSVEQEIVWEQNRGEENLFLTKGDMMTNSAERGSIEDNPQAKFFQGGAFSGKMCPHLCLKEICLPCTFHCVWFEKKMIALFYSAVSAITSLDGLLHLWFQQFRHRPYQHRHDHQQGRNHQHFQGGLYQSHQLECRSDFILKMTWIIWRGCLGCLWDESLI